MKIHHTSNTIPWENIKNASEIQCYLEILLDAPVQQYIKNCHVQVLGLEVDNIILPLTVNTKNFDDTWITSPYGQYVKALNDEIDHLNLSKGVTVLLKRSVHFLLGRPLRKTDNKIVYVNNWLISTNIYPQKVIDIEAVRNFLIHIFPDHAIGFRSLNTVFASKWQQKLEQAHFGRFVSRYVFLWDPSWTQNKKVRADFRKDYRPLSQKEMRALFDTSLNDSDIKRVLYLYEKLYLEKYSLANPAYTYLFIYQLYRANIIHIDGVMLDEIEGFYGSITIGDTVVTPIFGWNTELNKKAGIYRIVSAQLFKRAQEHGWKMNNSAGANHYKKNRGCRGSIEYQYVYYEHLDRKKKHAWRSIQRLLNTFGEKILTRSQGGIKY